MKAITLITAFFLCTTSLFAQLSFNNESKPTDQQEFVELLIVRNAEECLGYESSILELIDGKKEKIAFLYHESSLRNAASNFYNLNTIREVLDKYSDDGYRVSKTSAENMDGRCNRTLKYIMVRDANLALSKK
ncbi:MAG: hypothetical protein RLP15_08190 [Cryomorphaceae bacterium]